VGETSQQVYDIVIRYKTAKIKFSPFPTSPLHIVRRNRSRGLNVVLSCS